MALFQALAFVKVEPRILLDLFEAVSQSWLGYQDVFDEVPHLLGQVASKLVVG